LPRLDLDSGGTKTNKKHWSGPWIDSRRCDAIVVENPPDDHKPDADTLKYYGGEVVAESVAPENKPLIKAAPELLSVCKTVKERLIRDGVYLEEGYLISLLKSVIAKAEGGTIL